MQRGLLLFLVITTLFIFPACFERYNFNLNPPYVNARLNEVFPESIRNSFADTVKLDITDERYMGYTASYLDGALTMTAVKCVDKGQTFEQLLVQKVPTQAALDYFNKEITAQFKAMQEHSIKNEDGYWQAIGKDKTGRKWLAWVNTLWVFVISGKDQDTFDLAVRASRFVNKWGQKE